MDLYFREVIEKLHQRLNERDMENEALESNIIHRETIVP